MPIPGLTTLPTITETLVPTYTPPAIVMFLKNKGTVLRVGSYVAAGAGGLAFIGGKKALGIGLIGGALGTFLAVRWAAGIPIKAGPGDVAPPGWTIAAPQS